MEIYTLASIIAVMIATIVVTKESGRRFSIHKIRTQKEMTQLSSTSTGRVLVTGRQFLRKVSHRFAGSCKDLNRPELRGGSWRLAQ